MTRSPHVLGIDEGPFEKGQAERVPVVAALCEGASVLEAVARTDFPVDGAGATDFLVEWIGSLRVVSALQAIALGGITFAGLGIIDVRALSQALAAPVLIVTRRPPDPRGCARRLRPRACSSASRSPRVRRRRGSATTASGWPSQAASADARRRSCARHEARPSSPSLCASRT